MTGAWISRRSWSGWRAAFAIALRGAVFVCTAVGVVTISFGLGAFTRVVVEGACSRFVDDPVPYRGDEFAAVIATTKETTP